MRLPHDLMLLPLDLPSGLLPLLQRCAAESYPCLLDGGGPTSWSDGLAVLGFGPRAVLRVACDGAATVRTAAGVEPRAGDPFELLDRFVTEWRSGADPAGSPCAGGVVVALSYDLRRWVERVPARVPDPLGLPVLHAAAYDWFVTVDHRRGAVQLAVRSDAGEDHAHLAALLQQRARLPLVASGSLLDEQALMVRRAHHERERASAEGPTAHPQPVEGRAVGPCERSTHAAQRAAPQADVTRATYTDAVRAALAYIAAGDIYQVNLAQCFTMLDPPPPATVFAALQRNPMPFGAYVDGGDFALLSSSPECFLTVRGAEVATYPIKGTRPRGPDAASDAALVQDLLADPKERAEHVMIVDLERNDLGRVCRTGSVRVADLCRVETFPTLHHLVSRVSGELRDGMSLSALLRATFPGGSITGAPKVRAMQIIDALEPVNRGFYTGALGWIRADGSSIWSLLIRTAIATPGRLTYHAGGGIVADSVIDSEYEETLLKARPFLAALEVA